MTQFRKKPVVIEAVRWNGATVGLTNGKEGAEERLEMPDWMPSAKVFTDGNANRLAAAGEVLRVDDYLLIGTLEGTHRADPGDWIIRGAKGELYPCKPDIFAITYDLENKANASAQHQGLPVAGYQPQSGAKVALVNEFKQDEERLLRKVEALFSDLQRKVDGDEPINADQRWLAIAKTHFQEGFMALNRAVFQPQRIALPEDDEDGIEDMPVDERTVAQQATDLAKS